MTDNDILIYFCGKGLKHINHKKLINIPKDINDYLNNRYSDSFSIKETIIRIFHNINEHPKCPICGNPCELHKYKHIFLNTCNNIQCIKEYSRIKREKTMLEKYGYKNSFENENILNKAIEHTLLDDAINKRKITYNNKTTQEKNNIKEKRKQTCLEKFNQLSSFDIEKSKNTKLKKYNNENYINLEKIKQTKLEKYGDENYINIEKIKQTNLERYGYEMPFNSKEIQEKIHDNQIKKYNCLAFNSNKQKETCLNKYGVDNVFKSEQIKKKIKLSRIEHFGQYLSEKQIEKLQSSEVINKRTETKRKNHTFNTSIPETESYELLKEKYPDVQYQYKSELYPFACDFYIPSLDLYIECNYHWTHGNHPYTNSIQDNIIVENWKAKHTKYYNNAINIWTIRDVKKRKIAKQNNLNYKEFWNINKLKEWLNI